MKTIVIAIASIFPISSLIFHLWTTYYAFSEGGFWSGIVSFILPFLSEAYWCYKMWGQDDLYTTVACLHFLGAIIYTIFVNDKN
jgi:hypothetical protein